MLNCLACLSWSEDWSQAPLKSTDSKQPTLSSQTKLDDLMSYLTLKAPKTFFCNQEKASSFDTLVVTIVICSFEFDADIGLKWVPSWNLPAQS